MNHQIKVLAVCLLFALGCTRQPINSVKLYTFDCGKMRLGSIAHFNIEEDETNIRDLAVPCYVIEHERGLLLWDGGLSSVRAGSEGWQDLGGYFERLDRTLAEQLDELGLSMASFDFIAFSHMHSDHVGVANEVTNATLLIQEAEYEAAFHDEITIPFFDPMLYEELEGLDRVLLRGEHDVFGDGRVRIIAAPGHTPGHQVLFVDLEAEGPVILSGDLYHFRFSREKKRVPKFNWDANLTRDSFDKIEEILRKSGAKLWIQHDLVGFEERRKAPEFYN